MKFYKQTILMALALFPMLSFATLTADKETIANSEKTNIVFGFGEQVKGDVYIVKEFRGQLETLNKEEDRWVPLDTNVKPYQAGDIAAGEIRSIPVSANANGVSTPAGKYSFFLLLVKSNLDPFKDANWLSFESKTISINLEENTVPVPVIPEPVDPEPVDPEPVNLGQITRLSADKTTLDNQETTKVLVSLNETEISDQFLVVENEGQFWFLNNEGLFVNEAVPFFNDKTIIESKEILEVNAKGIKAGEYTLYHVVTNAELSPFEDLDWRSKLDTLADDNNKLSFRINLGGNEAAPISGSGRFGFEANTLVSTEYLKPMLPERVLGSYTDVVKSKVIWDALPEDEKEVTLYWDVDYELKGGEKGEMVFDSALNSSSTSVRVSSTKLTIANPLKSGASTAYPGCVDAPEWQHVRKCGEVKNDVIEGSEVFSQRWVRLKNVEVKSAEAYELQAQIVIDNILPHEVLFNFPLNFEMSVSKIPGDFSENSCKANSAIQYSSTMTVSLTQRGFKTNLPEQCQIDSEEVQMYYINVRAVHIDTANKQITESTCKAGSGCKFELYAFVD